MSLFDLLRYPFRDWDKSTEDFRHLPNCIVYDYHKWCPTNSTDPVLTEEDKERHLAKLRQLINDYQDPIT